MTKDFAPMAIDANRFAVAAKVARRDLEQRGLSATQEERSVLLWAYGEQLLGLVEEGPAQG